MRRQSTEGLKMEIRVKYETLIRRGALLMDTGTQKEGNTMKINDSSSF